MNQYKQQFLSQFTCPATRAFAEHLYDLESQSIASHTNRARDRVLEIVDFDEIIDESELKTLGIKLETEHA